MIDEDLKQLPPRNAWGLIKSRKFGTFFFARLFSAMGVWLHSVVAAIAAFDATQSALIVGLVSVVQFGPQVLFAPLAGKWADRGNFKFQLLLGQVIAAIGSLTLALWYLLGDGDSHANATMIIASSLVFGMGLVVGGPAMQSTAPLLVSRSELPAAMALNTAPMTLGRIAGPMFGSLGIALLGYGTAFLIGSMLLTSFVLLVSFIKFPTVEGQRKGEKRPMREALRFVMSDRPVLLTLIGVTAVGLGSEPIVTLAPALAAGFGDTSGHTVSLMVTSLGIGAAVAAIISSVFAMRIRQDRVVVFGMSIMGLSLGACFFPIPLHYVLLAFALTGFGFIVTQSSLSTIMQMRLPPLLRGRVMALWLIGFVGSRPLGAVLVGAATDAWTVYVAFAAVGVFMLIAAAVCRPSQLRD